MDELHQVIEAAMGIAGDVTVILVNEAIGKQEDPDTQLFSSGIFDGIVAYHDAFFRRNAQRIADILVIGRIGFRMLGILIGCKMFKIRHI